jgi:hypothetical protein
MGKLLLGVQRVYFLAGKLPKLIYILIKIDLSLIKKYITVFNFRGLCRDIEILILPF